MMIKVLAPLFHFLSLCGSTSRLRQTPIDISRRASVQKAGQRIYYDPEAATSWFWWHDYPEWEPNSFKVFQRFISPETVVLDIGSWIGLTALWEGYVAKKVIALEPIPKAFMELKMNLQMNPELAGRVEIINQAMGAEDGHKEMTNHGNSIDRIASLIDVPIISINTLREKHPELESIGFVKIDTEGYERVIVPALEKFFKQKRPIAFISLHENIIGHAEVQSTVDNLANIFPFLYEIDMVTPFNCNRTHYTYGDHRGADIIGTWAPLH
eukprot:gnl/MRDRNA2_/MRDRNA2_52421_c0_seq1.p1 gnl/MRDRNA2_/MRDRNA2_52421_c0~~gnl/MRDRNA2_/MRDRNA2_52421_c0_seq1.p1  ORF type:complete len:269 (+),score=42.22 gnl/MRDRNA2_/MRDRNA2_52421_c0_seq1:49-855(+)